MIRLDRRRRGLPYRLVWFEAQPRFAWWPLTVYYQSPLVSPVPGLVRRAFHTLVQDLSQSEEALSAALNGTTRTQVRQAEKLGVACSLATPTAFLGFFNEFAAEKGIDGTTAAKLDSFGAALTVTQAQLGGQVLAMHAWVTDRDAGRVRLLHSATGRFGDPETQNASGRANRLLHWWEVLTFKQDGYRTYDWGGYAVGTEDPAKQGINRFKDGFGGRLVEESHYYPWYLGRGKD